MKAMISGFLVVFGLTLGLMVLWATTTPGSIEAPSVVGGWIPMWGAHCCDGTSTSTCGAGGCAGGGITICDTTSYWTSETCGPTGGVQCSATGSWNLYCNDMHDAICT